MQLEKNGNQTAQVFWLINCGLSVLFGFNLVISTVSLWNGLVSWVIFVLVLLTADTIADCTRSIAHMHQELRKPEVARKTFPLGVGQQIRAQKLSRNTKVVGYIIWALLVVTYFTTDWFAGSLVLLGSWVIYVIGQQGAIPPSWVREWLRSWIDG